MESQNESIKKRADQVFIGNYLRYPAAIESGEGCELIDADGNRYLDFLSGIAVCALGHCHPSVTQAISEQASRLVHVSNLYYTLPQTELAELLVENTFADKVFIANSGAAANDAAIKLARIASGEGCYEIITLQGSFHGRTLATVAATISDLGSNIENVSMEERDGLTSTLHFVMSAHSRQHLADIMRRLRLLTGVLRIYRMGA